MRSRGNLSPATKSGKPTTELDAFATSLTVAGPILGLDIGEKTIGLAVSDATRLIASPLDTIRRKKWTDDLARLVAVIHERHVVGLVAGLPVNMDGTEGRRAQATRQIARNILKEVDLPFLLWDERLSTQAVERAMLEADMSRAKRAEMVDRLAAAYILQGVLDALKRRG
jgi:putative pre-16S rRNA nuclease